MPSLSLPPLVSASWLAEQLGADDLVIVDASWYLPAAGRNAREEYLAAHIPGAVYFDLDAASDQDAALPHMLATPEGFGSYAGGLGIGADTRVIVYDGSGNNLSAARSWWMFRAYGHAAVALLDGGLGRWRAEGRPLEAGDRRRPSARFLARDPGTVVRTREQVQEALADGVQVVDMRSAGRFRGSEPEPRAGLASGHIAGAVNLPFTTLVHRDGTALSEAELRERIAAAGVRLDRPIIATCGSGVTACTLLHALERLGAPVGALYDGSWTDWVTSGLPVARAEDPA